MTYQPFDPSKPYVGDSGPDIPAKANVNDVALRDAIIAGGLFKGFTFAPSGGTAGQPAQFLWTNGATYIKAVPTWGSGAGQDGNITALAWSLSTDSGANYDAIATASFSFDANGELTAATRGPSPRGPPHCRGRTFPTAASATWCWKSPMAQSRRRCWVRIRSRAAWRLVGRIQDWISSRSLAMMARTFALSVSPKT